MAQGAPRVRRPGRLVDLPDGGAARIFADDEGVEFVALGVAEGPRPALGLDAPFAVYCPHTVRHEHTAAGLPGNTVFVNVSASNIAYYVALLDWWSRNDTFMIVEHDVVCRADVIASFEACPEPWCVYAYDDFCCIGPDGISRCREGWRNLLGCTRFRSELMQALPDAVSSIPADNWDWHNVCDGVGNNLRAAGFSHHWHGPSVHHAR